MDSFLREAHDYVYAQLDPPVRRKKTVITLEPGSYQYDWHNDIEDEDIDPGLVKSVWLVDKNNNRFRMIPGITERHREDTSRGQPVRYDTLNGQIELWPIPDGPDYGLLIEYTEGKPRFFADADRPGVNDRLVVLYAIYMAQVHYRHPSYQATSASFNALLAKEKAKQHADRRYFINHPVIPEGEVVGENGDYKFVVR